MTFGISSATAADIPAMHRVRGSVRENRLSDPERVTQAAYRPYVAAGSAWVAENAAGIAGFAALDASAGRVWALFVAPECEGAGIGRALHGHMLAWARERGIAHLSLSTEPGSRSAGFYLRAGWRQAGITPDGELIFRLDAPFG